jgi:signal transduction histidine kinase
MLQNDMSRFIQLIFAAVLSALPTTEAMASTPPDTLTLTQLETRLEEIDAELSQLARLTLRTGVGNVGWLSITKKNRTAAEWVQIELSGNTLIDRVVLAPIIWNDAEKGPQADGFPEALEIVAGTKDDPKGTVIARIGPETHMLPRVAPLVIDLPPTLASWIRIQSTRLAFHAKGEQYRFKLSEILVFSGERNVALNRPVSVSSSVDTGWGAAAFYKEALVDGLTPYLMDAAGEEKSNPYIISTVNKSALSFTIDLGDSRPINGIRIHGADVNEYTPQINPADFGMPKHFTVEGAQQANFSDAVQLLDYQLKSIYQAGNILEWQIPQTDCRYVKLIVPKDAWPLDTAKKEYCISWAEIEILSNGHNVAMGKKVQLTKRLKHTRPSSLTDGMNHFGTILPTREWMEQLARRHDLQTERPVIFDELTLRYTRQKTNLQRMVWLAALLAAGTIITILIEQIVRQRAIYRTRERIAANLHDELGANLNAIALLGDYAKNLVDQANAGEEWRELTEVVDEVRTLTEETGMTARHCTNLLEATGLNTDIIKEIERISSRLLADMEHETTFESIHHLENLPPRKRIDLILFYKESLNNIIKHSGASRVCTHLSGDQKGITLSIQDNGRGLSNLRKNTPPASLKRRAKLIGGKIHADSPPEGGTRITLRIRTRTTATRNSITRNSTNP